MADGASARPPRMHSISASVHASMLIIRRSAAFRGVLRRPLAVYRVPCACTRRRAIPLCARLDFSTNSGRAGWLSRITEWAGFRDAPAEPASKRTLDRVEDAADQPPSAMEPVVAAGASFSPVDDAEAEPDRSSQLRRMRLTKESRRVIVDAIDAFGRHSRAGIAAGRDAG